MDGLRLRALLTLPGLLLEPRVYLLLERGQIRFARSRRNQLLPELQNRIPAQLDLGQFLLAAVDPLIVGVGMVGEPIDAHNHQRRLATRPHLGHGFGKERVALEGVAAVDRRIGIP